MKGKLVILATLSICLLGCRKGAEEVKETAPVELKKLDGSVYFQERMVFPDDAIIKVSLEDVSRKNAPSEIVATTETTTAGNQPWGFSMEYDPAQVMQDHSYVLKATISAADYLMFSNKGGIPVSVDSLEGPIDILVTKISPYPEQPAPETPASSLTDTYWKLTEVMGQSALLNRGDEEPHMVLHAQGTLIRGFAGCNHFQVPYRAFGSSFLSVGRVVISKKECNQGDSIENLFLMMLRKLHSYRIDGNSLELLDSGGTTIARFETVE